MESKTECAILYGYLDYDKKSMADNIADKYAGYDALIDNEAIHRGSNTVISKISAKNQKWNKNTNKEKGLILKEIATILQKNVEQISNLEFIRRGIKHATTKKDLNQMIKFFNYYADHINFSESPNWEPLGIIKKYFDDHSPLLNFGMTTAAALAAGNGVEIIAGNAFVTTLIFIKSLLNESTRLPVETLAIISESLYKQSFLLPTDNQTARLGSVMTVYENCDQDSAADMAIFNSSSRSEILPWTLRRIIVQESIYSSFVEKLNNRLAKAKPHRNNGDSATLDTGNADLNKIIVSRNIDLTKSIILLNDISPLLTEKIAFGKFIHPFVTIQSFRTTKEALALINSIPSFALSVWCEKQSICNEISLLADVSCVWQNLFGHISPSVPIEVRSSSEKKFFGGKQGILDTMEFKKNTNAPIPETLTSLEKDNMKSNDFATCVSMAKKLQVSWGILNNDARSSIFLKIAEALKKKREYYGHEKGIADGPKWAIDDVIKYLHYAAETCTNRKNECIISDKKICLRILRPVGVVYIGKTPDLIGFLKLAVSVAMFGNAVIYNAKNSNVFQLCKDLQDNGLPIVQYVIPENTDVILGKYDHINGFWFIVDGDVKQSTLVAYKVKTFVLQTSSKMALDLVYENDFMEMKFSSPKNIWSTYGETFAN